MKRRVHGVLAMLLVPVALACFALEATGQTVNPCANGDQHCISVLGPVGIGTAEPAQQLEVFDGSLQITRPAASAATALLWLAQKNVTLNNGTWALGARNAGHFVFYSAGGNKDVMAFLPNGNVGVGTTAPGQTLELTRTGADVGLRFQNPGQYSYTMGISNANDGVFALNRGASVLDSTVTPSLTIAPQTGNVGIGTSDSPTALTVSGAVTVGTTTVIDASGQWIGEPTNLRGPQGPVGQTGPQGLVGLQGSVGPKGVKGDPGPPVGTIAQCGYGATCSNGWKVQLSSYNTGATACQATASGGSCQGPASTTQIRCVVCEYVGPGGF